MTTTLCFPLCRRCGRRFEAHRSNAKWCPRCKPTVIREQRKATYEKSWVVSTCEECECEFVSTVPARWCPDHRPAHRSAAISAGLKRWYSKQDLEIVNNPWLYLLARMVTSCPRDEDCTTCLVKEWCGYYSGYTETIVCAESRPPLQMVTVVH